MGVDITLFAEAFQNVSGFATSVNQAPCRAFPVKPVLYCIAGQLNVRIRQVRVITRILLVIALLSDFSAIAGRVALAAEVPDPATMSAEERRAAYELMGEEERAAFRELMRNHYESLSPEEREAAKQKARERFENMTPEEREAARARAQEALQEMSPEERDAARQKARERFQNLSPDERKALREKMQQQRKDKKKKPQDNTNAAEPGGG